MRRVRYCVATSLDGYIAGPEGEADWIVMDPELDFKSFAQEFDACLVGRKTFESMTGGRPGGPVMGLDTYVVSRTLRPEDHPRITVIGDDAVDRIRSMRTQEGKDVWLFGGGELFRSLVAADLVDTVEVGVIPVLLGDGIPLFPGPALRFHLRLERHRVYEKTGTLGLEYSVVAGA